MRSRVLIKRNKELFISQTASRCTCERGGRLLDVGKDDRKCKNYKSAEGEAVVGEPWIDNGVYLKKMYVTQTTTELFILLRFINMCCVLLVPLRASLERPST